MSKFQTLIVGAHFRPPAKQLLAVLAQGQPLRLEEDNENAYDASAVRVMLDLAGEGGAPRLTEVQLAMLEQELPNVGLTLEQLMSTGPVQLGYLPAQDGKPLAKIRLTEPDILGNQQVREIMLTDADGGPGYKALLGFAVDGSPRLLLEVEEG